MFQIFFSEMIVGDDFFEVKRRKMQLDKTFLDLGLFPEILGNYCLFLFSNKRRSFRFLTWLAKIVLLSLLDCHCLIILRQICGIFWEIRD